MAERYTMHITDLAIEENEPVGADFSVTICAMYCDDIGWPVRVVVTDDIGRTGIVDLTKLAPAAGEDAE